MKNYLLRSVVGVQIASFVIVGLLVLITQFINDKVYLYEYEPAQDFLSIVLTPFYILMSNSQYGNSFFLLLHSLCYFLFFSMVVGNIIGVVWYFIKKKTLKSSPWMKDFLLGEVIFIGLLVINYLIIYLTNHFSFEIEKDSSLFMFLAAFAGCFPIFLLGRWLWRRGTRLLGGIALAACGIALAFVSGISIYTYGQEGEKNWDEYSYENDDYPERDNNSDNEEGEDPEDFLIIEETGDDDEEEITYNPEKDTKGTYDPFAFKTSQMDYMEWDKPQEYYKWDFNKFNRDFLQKLFNQEQYVVDLEDIYREVDRSKASKEAQDKGLYEFTQELGKDSYMLSCFWRHLGTFTLEQMNQNQLLRYSARARYLLKVYYLDKGNISLYEEVYKVMKDTDNEVTEYGGYDEEQHLKNQLKALLRVYTDQDRSEELRRDLNNSDLKYTDIRWAYSFWARRYKEKNIPITLRILLDVNKYVKDKYPKEYEKSVM